jgi:hypothetical protein
MQLPLLDMEVVLQLHPRLLLYPLDPLEREVAVVPLLVEAKEAVAAVLEVVKEALAPEVEAKEAVVKEVKERVERAAREAQAAKEAALEGVVPEESDALES